MRAGRQAAAAAAQGPELSKAFTKEDDEAGFTAPPSRKRATRLTRLGASLLLARDDAAARELLEGAEIVEPARGPRAALGARVRFADERGATRDVVLVHPEEVGLVPGGVSVFSPLGQALLGTEAGDVATLEDRDEELDVRAVEWP